MILSRMEVILELLVNVVKLQFLIQLETNSIDLIHFKSTYEMILNSKFVP